MAVLEVLVVGGSIAGLSCAHSLLHVGCHVTVIDKSAGPTTSSSSGAGLGLDPQSLSFLHSWVPRSSLPTLPLHCDQNRGVDEETKASRVLTKDWSFGFRAAHWRDVHALLYESLGEGAVVLWGHKFLSLVEWDGKVKIKVEVMGTGETVEMSADLLVAADGCSSAVRFCFLPDHKLRYSGYSAWRGVLDYSGKEEPETITALRDAYPDLGNCLYFDLSRRTHSGLYELPDQRINWLWYVNRPEPHLKVNSVTMKVDNDMIKAMHEEAENVWCPQLANLIKETKEPFINVIYDGEPLPQLFWGNVVLVGDAAHPTTPHGLRSTNMSIVDAGVLARCVEKWGFDELSVALEEFQSVRLPVVSQQVLHSRKLGRLKQGLPLDGGVCFDPETSSPEEREALRQRNMPFFDGAPVDACID